MSTYTNFSDIYNNGGPLDGDIVIVNNKYFVYNTSKQTFFEDLFLEVQSVPNIDADTVDSTHVNNSLITGSLWTSDKIIDYIKTNIRGLDSQNSVKNFYDSSVTLPTPVATGDRYICSIAGNGWTLHNIYQYNGTTWDETIPNDGFFLRNEFDANFYVYSATLVSWNDFGYLVDHTTLENVNLADPLDTNSVDIKHVTNNMLKTINAASMMGATLTTETNLISNLDTLIPSERAVKTYVDNRIINHDSEHNDVFVQLLNYTNTNVLGKVITEVNTYTTGGLQGNGSGLSADMLDGAELDIDTSLTADSASRVPTQHAVKTYIDTHIPSIAGIAYLASSQTFSADNTFSGNTLLGDATHYTGIGGAYSASYALQVTGDLNVTGAININGSPLSLVSGTVGMIQFNDGAGAFGSSSSLTWDTGTSTFNATNITGNGSGLTNLPTQVSGASGLIQFSSGTAFSSSSNLHWDNTNSRLSIGVTTPAYAIDVLGDINVSGTFRVNGTAFTGGASLPGGIVAGDMLYYTGSALGRVIVNATATNKFVTQASSGTPTFSSLNSIVFQPIGLNAGINTTGLYNIAIGNTTLTLNTSGTSNIAIGDWALQTNLIGANNVAIGVSSNNYGRGYRNISIGNSSMLGDTSNSTTACVDNIALGYQSLYAITTGINNISIGTSSSHATTTGRDHVAIGYQTLANNMTGNYNVAIGSSALYNIRTNGSNVAIGYYAIHNADGASNIGIGSQALQGAPGSSANQSIAIGDSALIAVTTGSNNTAIGFAALTTLTSSSWNVSIGALSGLAVTGAQNTIIGSFSMGGAESGVTAADCATLGYQALYSITSGTGNIAIGTESSYHITTTIGSIAIGYQANYTMTGAGVNTVIGYQALYFPTGGSNVAIGNLALYGVNGSGATGNTAIGSNALKVSSGNYNVGVGYQVLFSSTTGANNVVVGPTAGYSLTGGGETVFIGNQAGYYPLGDYNVAIGSKAMRGTNGSTATTSVAIGYQALNQIANGNDNVAIGYSALYSLAAGVVLSKNYGNTVIGYQAGAASTSMYYEVCIGYQAGYNLSLSATAGTPVGYGIKIGYQAGYNSTYGNICIGYQAGYAGGARESIFMGYSAGKNIINGANIIIGDNTLNSGAANSNNVVIGYASAQSASYTGGQNTIIGTNSGNGITSGTMNTFLGYNSGSGVTTSSYITVIGTGITGANTAAASTWISGIRGTTTVAADAIAVLISSTGQLGTVSSSAKYKQNIVPIQDSIIQRMNPVSFTMKSDETNTPQYGLVAEEVALLDPSLVYYKDGEPETIYYHFLDALMIKEMQNLKQEINDLKLQVKNLTPLI